MKIVKDNLYIKILFFGTALAGKTTSLQWLVNHFIPADMKISEKITSIETSFGQTLLFDFIPIQLGPNLIVRLFSTTGQDYYKSTRKSFLEDTDGVFFVVDSQKEELRHNQEFVEEFKEYLKEIQSLNSAKVIILYNKTDLKNSLPPEELGRTLGLNDYPSFPVSAVNGNNLREAFVSMIEMILCDMLDQEHA